MQNMLFVISGPSGVGKGTLVKLLVKENPALALSISCTTRVRRTFEVDGKDYFFLTREEFEKRIQEGDFLEWDEHFDNLYGTPLSFVKQQLETKSVILEIDVVGGMSVKKNFPDIPVVLIMVIPPDLDTLVKRLAGRKSETDEERKNRLARVCYELGMQTAYDYIVINDDLQEAKHALERIIEKEITAKKGDKI